MMTAETVFDKIPQQLGLGAGWELKNGSWWKTLNGIDVRATAAQMVALDARFVAITAAERTDREIRLDYQWDVNGQLFTFIYATRVGRVRTITDLCPAADWIERETHEYFAVEFIGRANTKPLMTRAGDPIGINLRKEVVQ
jgi:NADH:ubiquinone oxidoreductase subunit C